MKLTKAQIDVLEQAALVAKSKRGSGGGMWFTPSRHESALVYGHTNTCKALCGKGLLEYRVYIEAMNGWPAILEFCITEAGQACQPTHPTDAVGASPEAV